MAIGKVSVTVDVDGVSATASVAKFTDGGVKIWSTLVEQAAEMAKVAAQQLKEAAPDLPDWPEDEDDGVVEAMEELMAEDYGEDDQ